MGPLTLATPLESLPTRQREAILALVESYPRRTSLREIGRRMGISHPSVVRLLARATENLAKDGFPLDDWLNTQK